AERPGGVPTVVDWWFTFLNRWGHRATALYAAFEGDGIGRWERLRQTIRTWRVHRRKDHPHPTLANAPLPAPLWLFYFMPQWIFGNLFDQFDQVVVAGGPCLHALPLALRRERYILWLGTIYEIVTIPRACRSDSLRPASAAAHLTAHPGDCLLHVT
ncbi:MAG: hypothetical protein WBH90_08600, partial [Aggregatilineales bacterium]